MRENIKAYIEARRKEGHSDESIRKKFIASGYDEKTVDTFFADMAGLQAPVAAPPVKEDLVPVPKGNRASG